MHNRERSTSRKRPLSSSEKVKPSDKKACISTCDTVPKFPNIEDSESQNLTMEAKVDKLVDSVKALEGVLKTLVTSAAETKESIEKINSNIKHYETKLSEACETILELKDTVASIPRMQSEILELQKKNQLLEEKLLKQDEYSRRENLIFEGLSESGKNEDCFDLINNVLKSVGLENIRFQRCHRLGQYKPLKKRAIVARFVFFQDKLAVLKKREDLRDNGIIIHDDLPPEVSARRARLRPILRYLKDNGEEATLIRDKLMYKGEMYTVDTMHSIPYDLTGISTKITDTHVFFSGEFSPLSNLYPCRLDQHGINYIGSEQFYQREKYLNHRDDAGASKLLNCPTNYEAMVQSKALKTTKQWKDNLSLSTMKSILKIKMEQVPAFKDMVTANKGKKFVEATTNSTWGIGLRLWSDDIHHEYKWKGDNKMGEAIESLLE